MPQDNSTVVIKFQTFVATKKTFFNDYGIATRSTVTYNQTNDTQYGFPTKNIYTHTDSHKMIFSGTNILASGTCYLFSFFDNKWIEIAVNIESSSARNRLDLCLTQSTKTVFKKCNSI